MTTMRTLMLLAVGLGASALGGCGADVPAHPTWQDDVYPIMVARCVRCHNSTGTPDPLYMPTVSAFGNFDHASFGDFAPSDLIHFWAAKTWILDATPAQSMPPAPAAKLADWQIQTITNFIKDQMPSSQ